jgi:hypothetical protein
MDKSLPIFKKRAFHEVEVFIAKMLTNHEFPQSMLRNLIEYEDNHFRAVFEQRFFVLLEGDREPTKSQWNNLKKKLKRSAPNLFIYKDHGALPCPDQDDGECYFLDFGFFVDYR